MTDPKFAAFQELLNNPELRQKFKEQPLEVLESLGVDVSQLSQQELEDLELDPHNFTLEQRHSKSAWFGGNPFG